ncbi:Holliday junction resolvase RuvX [Nocardioides marmoribigeumensis]|uniref:Holliday junction resolvase RuvX n=1 Tax=Nocardioides marmoribigeumensis TaxID=433649 RepID=UPI00286D332F|nr:Holliday junction resolvase RuvX [Nocardioides marmoribigeumensis]
MREGARIGVDVGDVRVGVATSDRSGLLATPVETLPRGEDDVPRLVALVAEHEAVEVVVGLPRSLSGQEGPAAAKVRAYADQLVQALGAAGSTVGVRLCDERMSTVTATHQLREHGGRGKKHGRKRRAVVDQAAAVVILQNALDTERATGAPPGELVGGPPG